MRAGGAAVVPWCQAHPPPTVPPTRLHSVQHTTEALFQCLQRVSDCRSPRPPWAPTSKGTVGEARVWVDGGPHRTSRVASALPAMSPRPSASSRHSGPGRRCGWQGFRPASLRRWARVKAGRLLGRQGALLMAVTGHGAPLAACL